MGKIRGCHERSIRVANVTILTRWQMVGWFSVEFCRGRAESIIMTSFTATDNAQMNITHKCR